MRQADSQQNSDEDLVLQFQGGDHEAFNALIHRYEKELYGYLRRYTGDASLAEDVFQNTFLQIFTKIGSYEPGRPLRPWLYTIATNQAIDAMRRAGRHQAISLDQNRDTDADGSVQNLITLLESQGPTPLHLIQVEERREWIRNTVAKLPDFLQQVVILAYYQNLKYREIAEVLSIPVGTVKSRLHSALTKLQEQWQESLSYHE